jgi:hypothetical protein
MRNTGFNNLIFLEVPYGLSNYRWREQDCQDIQRSGVVYEYHDYVKPDLSKGLDEWKNHVSAMKAKSDLFGYPLYIGEWSIDPLDSTINNFEYITQTQIEYLDQLELSDCIHSYGRFYGYKKANDGGWTDAQISEYESIQTNRPPYTDENGGEEMSFEYKNETSADETIYKRKVVVTDTPITIPAGGSVTIDLAEDEIIVKK